MKYLVGLAMLFVAGCTKNPLCDVAKSIADGVKGEVAKQLDCKNQEAIKATIVAQLEKIKVCEKAQAMSPIGDLVCQPLVDGLLGAVQTQIPAEWECTGGPGKELVKTKLIEVCQKAL